MRSLQRGLWAACLFLGAFSPVVMPGGPGSEGSWFSVPPASARSSGGRSGGGSFRSRPPATRSAPAQPQRPPSMTPPRSPSSGRGPVFVPLPTQPQSPPNPSLSQSSASGSGAIFSTLVVLILGGVGLAFLVGFLLKRRGPVDPVTELSNDTVTVSQIQVALVAHAGSLQQALSTLALQADTRTPEGLLHLLQESALIVLRHSESWTHVYAESQTVPNLDIAQKVFNQMAIAERSKMSAETLVNVGGRVQQQSVTAPGLEEGPAAYIVVTLLMGTAHDQPLFGEIKTVEALQSALSEIAALTADYLCVLEVLWSPQSAEDSLTYDELLTEYSDLVQL